MLSSREIEAMSRDDLVTIGCHTHAHELLDQIAADLRTATMDRSQTLLRQWTGAPARHFSYPNGNYNPEVVDAVKAHGFTTAVTTRSGWWRSPRETHTVPRYGVGRFDTMSQLKARLSGFL
jgi:peptidoglycan/xylan/chitin deacetylase (PgdA/CDA1 family)